METRASSAGAGTTRKWLLKGKDRKKKLHAEELEKRKAPFMPIVTEEGSQSGGGSNPNPTFTEAGEDPTPPEEGGPGPGDREQEPL